MPAVQELTREESLALIEVAARRELKMGAEEFLQLWSEGKIEDPDRPEVLRVAMLLPLLTER